ncbi:MAG: glucose/arabinose dehydrogenase [Arenicella sp.]|jgi:glucose/arabinose dehydrogenase
MKTILNLCRWHKHLGVCLVLSLVVLVHSSVQARGQYLDQWEEFYPVSTSDLVGCQLCHQNPGGGNGWNRYGWAIRPLFLDFRQANGGDDVAALKRAMEEVEESVNPDASDAYTFLDEIRYNTQPGWALGDVNTINYKSGSDPPLENQPPVILTMGSATEIDLLVSEVVAPGNDPLPTEPVQIELNNVAGSFNAPVKAVRALGINGSLFVVEQRGKIIRVDLATGDKTQFYDVSENLVAPRAGFDERGLLSLAFHPNFANNGLFYTYQSEPVRPEQNADFTTLPANVAPNHRSMVVEYVASNPSCNSSIRKNRILLTVDQPQFNHNGGDLAFGPDGYLYVSFGDGGGADDQAPNNNPQRPENGHGLLGNGRDNSNLLGSIIRIDPAGVNSSNSKYGIPADNPFVGISASDEIYAYGFRNPYRFSFDSLCFGEGQSCDTLMAADVGQNKLEEIDNVISGGNYGWNWKEGSLFFIDPDAQTAFLTADTPPGVPVDLIDPIAEYGRDIGVSVIGGFIYRGSDLPMLNQHYVFADFARTGSSRNLMSLDGNNVVAEFSADVSDNVTGFGQDAEGELYIVTNPSFGDPLNTQGTLQKIIPLGASYQAPDAADESAICPPSEDLCLPIKTSNGKISIICL